MPSHKSNDYKTITFSQDFFGIFKNGQKKCPKSKTQNTFVSTFSLII